jgi:hypothetical protein
MRFPGFVGPSYKNRKVNVDCQRCVNLYPEKHELGTGKEQEQYSLHSTPGLSLKVTVGAGPIRAAYTASNDQVFVVSGSKLYRVSSSWVATELGTLSTSTGPVSMADNGLVVMLVDGTAGYTWTIASSTFATITDPDFPGADQVTYQDGYFLFNVPDTGQFMITGLNATTVDALDIAEAEGSPDKLIAMISDHRDVWLFGQKTTEVFFNSGNADFPFERVQGAFIEHGCAAAFSVAKMNNTVFWVGRDEFGTGVVYMAQGYQPQRISTHPIEQAMQGYADITAARGYAYQQDGHFFYVLNFDEATWVFDSSTGFWHERAYLNAGVLERHRGQAYCFGHGKHLVGDYEDGKLYELSNTTYSDNGAEIVRERVSPHVSSSGAWIYYQSFQLDVVTGVGLDGTGQGTDPKVILRWSDDGGESWSNEKEGDLGAIGRRLTRAKWNRLGRSRDRVFKIRITDPVPVTIMGANLEFSQGAG